MEERYPSLEIFETGGKVVHVVHYPHLDWYGEDGNMRDEPKWELWRRVFLNIYAPEHLTELFYKTFGIAPPAGAPSSWVRTQCMLLLL
jgi:hypothetical protein